MQKINVLDKGFVRLVDSMGNDYTPANDARISTGSEAKNEKDDINLIRFLLRHKHTTPFEGVILKFKVKAPIMVIREWFRHRTFSYNEESGRYRQLDPDYYVPDVSRISKQSTTNKQGSGEIFSEEESNLFLGNWKLEQDKFEETYVGLIDEHNMSKELARLNMPVSHYSSFVVTGNLLNWFRFLQLRMAPAAQFEIREFANAIAANIKEQYPICWSAFEDYWLNAISFTGPEIKALNLKKLYGDFNLDPADWEQNCSLKGRELQEFKDKLNKIIKF